MELAVQSSADIGKVVREKRKELGLTQMDAAGLMGVGVRFLSELERGKASLEFGKVLQVLQGLGLEIRLHDVRR